MLYPSVRTALGLASSLAFVALAACTSSPPSDEDATGAPGDEAVEGEEVASSTDALERSCRFVGYEYRQGASRSCKRISGRRCVGGCTGNLSCEKWDCGSRGTTYRNCSTMSCAAHCPVYC
jgi:hypothetical protein